MKQLHPTAGRIILFVSSPKAAGCFVVGASVTNPRASCAVHCFFYNCIKDTRSSSFPTILFLSVIRSTSSRNNDQVLYAATRRTCGRHFAFSRYEPNRFAWRLPEIRNTDAIQSGSGKHFSIICIFAVARCTNAFRFYWIVYYFTLVRG